MCAAITEIYRDVGKRTKRTRARSKFLVDEWGVERLRAEVETKLGRSLSTSVATADPIDPHRDHAGVHPQLQPGRYYLGATTLRGRFSGEQMIAVANIADRFGSGEVRCTNRQSRRARQRFAGASSRAPGWSSASSPSSRRSSGRPS